MHHQLAKQNDHENNPEEDAQDGITDEEIVPEHGGNGDQG